MGIKTKHRERKTEKATCSLIMDLDIFICSICIPSHLDTLCEYLAPGEGGRKEMKKMTGSMVDGVNYKSDG